jgi:hypothetical protein
MSKLCVCNKISRCRHTSCSHRKPHKKRTTCEGRCGRISDEANCEFINQGFNPEEIILKSFGSTNG